MTERISGSDPVQAGSSVTICYETLGAQLPVTVRIHWDPDLGHVDVLVEDRDVGSDATVVCFPVTVPAGCQGGLAEDLSHQSDDYAITVTS